MREAGYAESTATRPSDLTNSKAYKMMYAEQMAAAKITTEQFFKNIGDGMNAMTMIYNKDGDIVVTEANIPLRLQANKQAEPYLFGKDNKETEPLPVINSEAIVQAIKSGNIEELQRIVFKKDDV